MDNGQEDEFSEDRKDQVQAIVDNFWEMVCREYDSEDLSEEEMMDIMGALGIIIGAGLNEAFYINPSLPYQLQGIVSDFTYQTQYSARYGIDFSELEESRQNTH
jgi:hypothetical protein